MSPARSASQLRSEAAKKQQRAKALDKDDRQLRKDHTKARKLHAIGNDLGIDTPKPSKRPSRAKGAADKAVDTADKGAEKLGHALYNRDKRKRAARGWLPRAYAQTSQRYGFGSIMWDVIALAIAAVLLSNLLRAPQVVSGAADASSGWLQRFTFPWATTAQASAAASAAAASDGSSATTDATPTDATPVYALSSNASSAAQQLAAQAATSAHRNPAAAAQQTAQAAAQAAIAALLHPAKPKPKPKPHHPQPHARGARA